MTVILTYKPVNRMSPVHQMIDDVRMRNERYIRIALNKWTTSMRATILQAVRRYTGVPVRDLLSKAATKITTSFEDWGIDSTKLADEGKAAITPAYLKVMEEGGNTARQILGLGASFNILDERVIAVAEQSIGYRITSITEETLGAVRQTIAAGLREGLGPYDIGASLRPVVGLSEKQAVSLIRYKEGLVTDHPTWSSETIDRKVMAASNALSRQRMETIARTETAYAASEGYLESLRGLNVPEVQFSPFAGCCPECASYDTQVQSTKLSASAFGVEIPVHPNCRCAWLPYLDGHAITEPAEPRKPINLPKPGQKEPPSLEESPSAAEWRQEQKTFIDGVTDEQRASLERNTEGYNEIQDTQRAYNTDMLDLSKLTDAEYGYLRDAANLEEMIDNSPGVKAKMYRGMTWTDPKDPRWLELQAQLESQQPFAFNQLSSFSTQKSVAEGYAYGADDSTRVLLEIKGGATNAARIAELSTIPEEGEILLGTGGRYQVVDKLTVTIDERSYIKYVLQEVKTPLEPTMLGAPGRGALGRVTAPSRGVTVAKPDVSWGKVSGWDTRLETHKTSLIKQLGFDPTKLKGTVTPKQTAALQKLVNGYANPKTTTAVARKVTSYQVSANASQEVLVAQVNRIYDTIDQVGGKGLVDLYNKARISVIQNTTVRRACSNLSFNEIVVGGKKVTDQAIWHEMGHMIENNKTASRKAYVWLEQRAGTKIRYQFDSIVSWSKDKELAFKDRFIDPYVGKTYSGFPPSTEVFSMGFQNFRDPKTLMSFAKNDFDHFAFVHGVMVGAI